MPLGMTGGEKMLCFIMHMVHFVSPSVTFGDSSLVRGSLYAPKSLRS